MPFWLAQESLSLWQWVARTVVMFLWLLLATKLMGQRELGRAAVFDVIVAITIGGIAAGTLYNPRVRLGGALVSTATLTALDILLALISLKSARLRRLIEGEPSVIIQNGHIRRKTMRRLRVSLDTVMEGLRRKGVPNLSDVEFAIIEPGGDLNVIPKSQVRPLTPADLGISTDYEGLPVLLIEDGHLLEINLRRCGLSTEWLTDRLREQGVEETSQVMAAMLDTKGRLFVSRKRGEE